MGELKIKLSDELENLFRKLAMRRFGHQKGSISEAAQEAIEEWTIEGEIDQKEQFWDSLEGVLKHVKKTSVQLQHQAWNSIVEKHNKKLKEKK